VSAPKIELLAFDVDGTLVYEGNEVSQSTRAALGRAEDAGLQVCIATGRRYRSTTRVVTSIGRPLPIVILGGALVKSHQGETIHRVGFPPGLLREVVDLLRERGQMSIGQRDAGLHEAADFVLDGAAPWNSYARQYHEENADCSFVDEDLANSGRDEIVVLGCFADEPEVRSLQVAVRERFGDRLSVHGLPGPGREEGWYCEIAPPGVSKWSGLVALAEHLGVDPNAICAVGDEVNDLPMFEGARLSVAMGQARPEVQAAADWVTGPVRENGIAELIDRLLG